MTIMAPCNDQAPAFFAFDPGLCCAGQPNRQQIARLAATGLDFVINLATEASTGHLADEAALWEAAGVDFTWQPVDWQRPGMADYRRFENWLASRRGKRCLVHCAKNYRASLLCFAYLCVNEGRDPWELWPLVLAVWEPDAAWSALGREVLAASGLAFPGRG